MAKPEEKIVKIVDESVHTRGASVTQEGALGALVIAPAPGSSINIGNALVPSEYDQIELSYTGSDLTGVVYKSDGATVATLTLAYADGNLTSVTRADV